jgi:sec-independent protein translocase protein TatA
MAFLLLFDVSGGELLLIVLVIIIFFGSKGIPDIARGLGKGIREVRDATDSIKREITDTARKAEREARNELDQTLDQAFSDEDYIKPPKPNPYDSDFSPPEKPEEEPPKDDSENSPNDSKPDDSKA